MAYLLDSGFVYAQLNGKDNWHTEVTKATLIAEAESLILPGPAVTEIAYLLQRKIGLKAAIDFIESLPDSNVAIEHPVNQDYVRTGEILRKYNDVNIDFVDACIVAMAERLNITKILTVDRRHFSIFRPNHCESFEILP